MGQPLPWKAWLKRDGFETAAFGAAVGIVAGAVLVEFVRLPLLSQVHPAWVYAGAMAFFALVALLAVRPAYVHAVRSGDLPG